MPHIASAALAWTGTILVAAIVVMLAALSVLFVVWVFAEAVRPVWTLGTEIVRIVRSAR